MSTFPTVFAPVTSVDLNDITDATMRPLFGTRAFTSGLAAIGTTTTKVKTAAIINYCIDGILYAKAITDDCFAFSDTTVQPVGTTKYYGLFLDGSGTATIASGTSTALPVPAAGTCMVGFLKIVTDATHTFTPGTTALSAAGITTTYFNASCAPSVLP